MTVAESTLHELVLALERFPKRKAIGVQVGIGVRWWTYAELRDAVGRASAFLGRHGLEPGQTLLIWGRNSPEWVAWLLACFWTGVVAVPVDDDLSESYVRSVVEACEPKLVLCDEHHLDVALGVASRDLSQLGPPVTDLPKPAGVAPSAPAIVVFTSGTMSTPRGVVLSHGNVMAQLRRFRRWRWVSRLMAVRMLGIAPLSHVQGLIVDICIPLFLGFSVMYVREVNAAHLIRTLRTYRVHVLATVPRVLQILTRAVKALPARGQRFAELAQLEPWVYRRHVLFTELARVLGWKFWLILVGGARLSEEDERFWRDAGKLVVQGYGMTETTAIATVGNPYFRPVGSIGKLPVDGSIRLADDGELLIRSESVSSSVLGGRAAREQSDDGYMRTGDLVRLGDGGHLFFVGRKDDVIVIGEGFNVFANEVEAALTRQVGVKDAVVCGLESDGHEQVHAVLLLECGADAAAIVDAANAQLERHQVIRSHSVWAADDLPRSSLLKVKRQQVKQVLLGRSASPLHSAAVAGTGEAATASTPIEQALKLLEAADDPRDDGRLGLVSDLGLSSLDVVEVMTQLERRHGVVLDHVAIGAESSVAVLRRELSAQRAMEGAVSAASSRDSVMSWGHGAMARAAQSLLRPLLTRIWFRGAFRLRVLGAEHLAALEAPAVIAVAPHRHWLDVLAAHEALPTRLRERVLTVTNYDFSSWRDGRPCRTWWQRCVVWAARRLVSPALFPVSFVPHQGSTRRGLFELASLLDRGFVPLTFPKGFHFGPVDETRHDQGAASLAVDAGVPIVPLWIEGNDQFNERRPWARPELTLIWGAPLRAGSLAQAVAAVEESFADLRERSRYSAAVDVLASPPHRG